MGADRGTQPVGRTDRCLVLRSSLARAAGAHGCWLRGLPCGMLGYGVVDLDFAGVAVAPEPHGARCGHRACTHAGSHGGRCILRHSSPRQAGGPLAQRRDSSALRLEGVRAAAAVVAGPCGCHHCDQSALCGLVGTSAAMARQGGSGPHRHQRQSKLGEPRACSRTATTISRPAADFCAGPDDLLQRVRHSHQCCCRAAGRLRGVDRWRR